MKNKYKGVRGLKVWYKPNNVLRAVSADNVIHEVQLETLYSWMIENKEFILKTLGNTVNNAGELNEKIIQQD